MPDLLRVSRVRFTPAPVGEAPRAVIGFASCSIADLGRLDGLAVHRMGHGRYSISLPGRRDQAGRRHNFFRPATQAIHEAIERGVIGALQARGVLP